MLDVNVVGMARVTRAALPHLRRSRARGDRQHVARWSPCVGVPQRALYAASKGAVARADAGDGRRPRARGHPGQRRARPGTADTPWVGRLLDQAPDAGSRGRGAAGQAADGPAGRRRRRWRYAIAYLASPLAGSTTGTALAVDGGMTGLRLPR